MLANDCKIRTPAAVRVECDGRGVKTVALEENVVQFKTDAGRTYTILSGSQTF